MATIARRSSSLRSEDDSKVRLKNFPCFLRLQFHVRLFFLAQDPNAYWEAKGLSTDKAGRQMSSFFDVDAYQDQMRQQEADKKKGPVKLTKKQLEEIKEKKRQKKLKKYLDQ